METLMSPRKIKASKGHRCNFCSGKISKGEVYIKSTHKYDGDVYDWKAHDYCSELASKLNMYEDADDGVSQDMFVENVCEAYYHYLTSGFTNDEKERFRDVLRQLYYVEFRQKIDYVIMRIRKQEKEIEKTIKRFAAKRGG